MAAADPNKVIQKIIEKLSVLAQSGEIDREVASKMLGVTSNRIFTEGKAADDKPIGKYSESYLKTRGRKGLGKNAKVILQFTQEMRNDFTAISTKDSTGLGFTAEVNGKKSRYVEETYKKSIFEHTEKELKQVEKLYGEAIERHLE